MGDRRRVALAAASGAAGAGGGQEEAPPRPLYWGAVIGKQLTGTQAPWDMNALTEFEASVGKGLSLLAFSSPFADCNRRPCEFFPFPTEAMETIRRHGAIPFLSWSSSRRDRHDVREPAFQPAPTSSRQPRRLHPRASPKTRGNGAHPFFLRFNREMNGFWFPWGDEVNGNKPGEFVTAWRHVHDIFTEVGATNATWVWCPNIDLTRKLQTPLQDLYPGDDYVDWTCLDGFNWGTTGNSAGLAELRRDLRIHLPQDPEDRPEQADGDRRDRLRRARRLEGRTGSATRCACSPARYPKVRACSGSTKKNKRRHWPLRARKPPSERSTADRAGNLHAQRLQRPTGRQDPAAHLDATAAGTDTAPRADSAPGARGVRSAA